MNHRLWDDKTQQAIDAMQTMMQAAYPEARFYAYLGEDPAGVYLNTYTRAEVTTQVGPGPRGDWPY